MNVVDLWKRRDLALCSAPESVEPVLHRPASAAVHSPRIPASCTLRSAPDNEDFAWALRL